MAVGEAQEAESRFRRRVAVFSEGNYLDKILF